MWLQYTYLQDLFDGIDGCSKEWMNFLVIIDVVGMTDTHEEDVGGEAGDSGRHRIGLYV